MSVKCGDREILKRVNLKIGSGQTHFIMGPNGAGKSTLGFALAGHPNYAITDGSIMFRGKNFTKLLPEERAKIGLFLAFQNPLEFEGIRLCTFLRLSVVGVLGERVNPSGFAKGVNRSLETLGMRKEFSDRYLNWGFSGGEKKKTEALQLLALKPKLAILDEIDSGLDVDSLRAVAKAITKLKKSQKTSLLVITHTSRIAKFLKPDFVHVIAGGTIVKSGDSRLLHRIEQQGYASLC